jgi:hypothetical protein
LDDEDCKATVRVLIAISGLTLQAATQREPQGGKIRRRRCTPLRGNLQRDATADPLVRRYEVPGEQSKDRWIRAIDFHPGDSSSIRSAFFLSTKPANGLVRGDPEKSCRAFPESVAALLPAASKVVVEIHYSANGYR